MIKKNRVIIIASLLLFLLACIVFTALLIQPNTEYKNHPGYEAYISDCNGGYEDVPYFGAYSAIDLNDKSKKYFYENSRRCGRFLITDYEDGVCINRYYRPLISFSSEINIPETLDGKPVVKLGSYLERREYSDGNGTYEINLTAFSGIYDCVLNIPSTVKYIEFTTVQNSGGMIEDPDEFSFVIGINVDKDNPYYYSENGVLFTKDKKTLLKMNHKVLPEKYENIIPDFVENFEPIDGIYKNHECIIFGKSIKKIKARVVDELDIELCNEQRNFGGSLIVKGYKGTVAEKWAKKYRLEFVPLDE